MGFPLNYDDSMDLSIWIIHLSNGGSLFFMEGISFTIYPCLQIHGCYDMMIVDPDAEVISLSPKTLLESDRYVCEIATKGSNGTRTSRCTGDATRCRGSSWSGSRPRWGNGCSFAPNPVACTTTPTHALGDLVGIKKHFRRKHSNNKQWVCEKCAKGYAVQSDYKAHLKTCGTRGHSCDCGRVFSRLIPSLSSLYFCSPLNFSKRMTLFSWYAFWSCYLLKCHSNSRDVKKVIIRHNWLG